MFLKNGFQALVHYFYENCTQKLQNLNRRVIATWTPLICFVNGHNFSYFKKARKTPKDNNKLTRFATIGEVRQDISLKMNIGKILNPHRLFFTPSIILFPSNSSVVMKTKELPWNLFSDKGSDSVTSSPLKSLREASEKKLAKSSVLASPSLYSPSPVLY